MNNTEFEKVAKDVTSIVVRVTGYDEGQVINAHRVKEVIGGDDYSSELYNTRYDSVITVLNGMKFSDELEAELDKKYHNSGIYMKFFESGLNLIIYVSHVEEDED